MATQPRHNSAAGWSLDCDVLTPRAILAAIGAAALLTLIVCLVLLTRQRDEARAALVVEQAAHARTVADVKAATAKAHAEDLAHARAVEARNAAIAQETQDDLTTRLAAARADADRFAARLRAQAGAGGGGEHDAGMSVAAAATGGADGAGEEAVVDARVCAENTVKAEGWREWWLRVSAD